MTANIDSKKVLSNAKKEGDKWLKAIKFDGKYNLKKIEQELRKLSFNGNPPKVVKVATEPKETVDLLIEGAVELYNGDRNKAIRELKKATPSACIWDYYFMAFWESAYRQLPEQNHEFMKHSLLEACRAGLGYIINMGELLVGVVRPEAYRNQGRLHREDGPAKIWGSIKEYYWHGIQVPKKWIMDKKSLKKKDFTSLKNQEQKRAFCEIIGWEQVLEMIGFKKIQSDDWGSLVETQLNDDNGRFAVFADVRCPSTNRRYLIRTDPSTKSCKEALAKSVKISVDDYDFLAES